LFDGRGWMSDQELDFLKYEELKKAVDEMEELLSQSKIGFLIGAGCSKCAGLPLTTELTNLVLEKLEDNEKKIVESVMKNFEGAETPTIEDYLSEIIDYLAILERRSEKGARSNSVLIFESSYTIEQLLNILKSIKECITKCIDETRINEGTHRKFIENLHKLRTGKDKRTYPIDYFPLNYDTLIEDALAYNKIHHVDGFKGGAHGWWDSNTFLESSCAARVVKLHGSIDWCTVENEYLPRRIRGFEFSDDRSVLIWPASTKYKETQKDPYVQMMNVFRSSLKSEASNPTILAICGYRFQDTHINIEIEKALLESNKNLTLLIFTEMEKPEGIVKSWYENSEISDQVRIHSKKGFFHNGEALTVESDVSWWKFEILTRLLGGER
jgi:hypothetical protein